MACAKQGVSLKEFITKSIIMNIEQYEDQLNIESIKKAKEDTESFIPWEEAKKKLGWND